MASIYASDCLKKKKERHFKKFVAEAQPESKDSWSLAG
jgi:hypothetical protein